MNYDELGIKDVIDKKETVWINNRYLPFDMTNALCELIVSDDNIDDASRRLDKFSSFFMKYFPETKKTNGLIESDLVEISNMKQALVDKYNVEIPGTLLLKKDSHLEVCGSIKARGGIYEVLKYAEDLAIKHNMLNSNDSYEVFGSKKFKDFFSNYTIQVGSTGNLGLSIGIMSAKLGFKVKVHMSSDAKEWKKELLRSKGVNVIEYNNDYSKAVQEGRKASLKDNNSYFIDDEKSVNLFLGYAVAAKRLKNQLSQKNIKVDESHPLIVYIPAGVGGAPGGVSYGLKRLFKDNVHCFFVEPVLCPSVLLGIATQKFEKIRVQDYEISGITQADGLACSSPSSFVTRIMTNLLSGDFTVSDNRLFDYLRLLKTHEDILIEPSSCAAFQGPVSLLKYDKSIKYCNDHNLTKETLNNSTQIVWATGGMLVPSEEYDKYLNIFL